MRRGVRPGCRVIIRHSNGRREESVDLQAALGILREVYPDAVAYQADGGEVSAAADTIEGDRVLVWEDEESSTDDDGARAVASIVACEAQVRAGDGR